MQGIKFKTNKQQFDLRKSLSKLFDPKRDCFSRLRALKSICDARDQKEVKETFFKNYSIIYAVFYETFIVLDSAKFLSNRKNATDDDRLLFHIWEKILLLLPELLERKWQMNSLMFLFKKCIHPNNCLPIRLEAMRLFLIYFQILGETNVRQDQQIEILFASLLPGIITDMGYYHHHLAEFPIDSNREYYGIRPYPIEPFIVNTEQSMNSFNSAMASLYSTSSLSSSSSFSSSSSSSSSSSPPSNVNNYPNYETKSYTKKFFTEKLLDYSITQCNKICWDDGRKNRRGFEFLFNSFARIYLPYIFPRMAIKNHVKQEWNDYTIRPLISVYNPPNEMPKLRKLKDHSATMTEHKHEHVPFLQAVVIQWLTKYLLIRDEILNEKQQQQNSTLTPHLDTQNSSKSEHLSALSLGNTNYNTLLSSSTSAMSLLGQFGGGGGQQQQQQQQQHQQQSSKTNNQNLSGPIFESERRILFSWLDSKRFNVDLVLNMFDHAFLWPFNEELSETMLEVIKVFRQWILKEPEKPIQTSLPLFLAEPPNSIQTPGGTSVNSPVKVSNNDDVRAGYMNRLKVIIMSSANVFLLEVSPQSATTLEKQVETSKRIFNIYRFMVMKVEMERSVWENLVQVLMKVTECIMNPQVPVKREDTLGGRLAPALFQTLVVTWIKTNLNIPVSNELWEQFHVLVSSLTNWEELIEEWKKTMNIVNRVMSRFVFQINLNDLPMDKTISDRKRELRNQPKLHHIRSVNSAPQQQQQQQQQSLIDKNQVTVSNQTANNHDIHHHHHHHHHYQNHQHQHQSFHDQVSRTSSNPESYRGDSKMNRFTTTTTGNDSTCDLNGSGVWKNVRTVNFYYRNKSTLNIDPNTVMLHKNCHQNYCLQNRRLKRSFSDSCLMLPIERSLCAIKTAHLGRVFRRRSCNKSYSSSSSAAKRSSRKSSLPAVLHKNPTNSKQQLLTGTTIGGNLPMIDDDEVDGEEEEEEDAMTLAESVDYQQDVYGFGGGGEFSDHDDASSLSEYLMLTCLLKKRKLYRSADDVCVFAHNKKNMSYNNNGINNGYHNHYNNYHHHQNHHHHHHHHHQNGNCSDSMGETLSLGASAPECNSLKETPLTFDSTSATSTCSSSITEQQMSIGSESTVCLPNKPSADANPLAGRPVMLGGQMKGWSPETAAIIWRRILEILGDVNDIKDPKLHFKAMDCLAKITEDFTKLRDHITYLNASSLLDNNAQLLVPSLHYYTSWLFRATTLPQEYNAGRLVAYKLLCTIAMYRSEQELSKEFLILFYLALKRAILTYDKDLINTVIKYCGAKFFSASLYGSSCLLFHFVSAANIVIGSNENKTYPRTESLMLLGSLIAFFDIFSNVQCLKSTDLLDLEPYTGLKDNVIEILVSASKRELNGLGRAISMCSLAIFVYREFMKQTNYHRIKDIIHILIAGTRKWVKRPKSATTSAPNTTNNAALVNQNGENAKFTNRMLCRVACDMLRLLADHAVYLLAHQPDFARRIIEGLCYTLELHIDILKRQLLFKDFKNLLLCIMFCLSHWCMVVDKEFLINTLVSEDYPGKFVDRTTNNGVGGQHPPQKSLPPCLLDLIIALYTALINIDPGDLIRNQCKDPQSEEILNASSVGDMDTIDYTIQMNDDESSKRRLIDQQYDGVGTIHKAAHLILLHFLNFMGHFPSPMLQTASLSALINENDDNPYVAANHQTDKVDFESLNAPNVLVFTVNDCHLMSFVELPLETFESNIWSKLTTTSSLSGALNMLPAKPIRIIIRNVLGKFAWDCMMLASPLILDRITLSRPMSSLANDSIKSHSPDSYKNYANDADEDDYDDENALNSFKNSLVKDSLELLVNSIHETTPECRVKSYQNGPDFLQQLNQLPEAVDTVALFINQHYQECQFIEDSGFNNRQFRNSPDRDSSISVEIKSPPNDDSSNSSSTTDLLDPVKAFQYCRQVIEQFGFLSWEKRRQIELLSKSQSTVRELRHLDAQQCRDKHKIAVIYVGPGQETKESILLNKSGSKAFEEFVGKLGWEVNLANHVGFMGGLQSNLSTGLTAPYYADSFNEVIFHVSTRLEPMTINNSGNNVPANDPGGSSSSSSASSSSSSTTSFSSQLAPIDKQQLMNMKMRHLGNDEIHIVWSEHYKEYRGKILATEFGDVLIVIYPLPSNTYPDLFRIQLMRKPDVPFSGPLFHGAVVHRDELPGLVRATAINASRGKRLNMENFKPYFEERYDTIRKVATKYKEPTTFEEFATRIYAPRYDLLQSNQSYPTTNPANLLNSGFITLEDFVQKTMPALTTTAAATTTTTSGGSVPSTPHSLMEPNSPASSTISVSEISFSSSNNNNLQQQPSSPAIIGGGGGTPPIIMDSVPKPSLATTAMAAATATTMAATSSSTGSSLRGLRPSSRSSIK